MGMTRSEIELLIRARDEAQGTFTNLNKQVHTVTGTAAQATGSMEKLGGATKSAGVGAQAAGVAFGLLADRVGRALVSGFNDSIAAANRLDRGLIGLASVATAFGVNADKAKAAAQGLAADGLMGVGDAATGLKNLLASGFGLEQAVVLMNRFKDSAAFGRQGSLEFGEAIRGATEGIKNGNSMMVDNAGVTKNLSNILVEAGFAATDLSKATTDVNIRQALFNGILKETNPQLGDAAKLLGTAAGAQTVFNAQIEIAQQKIGKALQPALGSALAVLTPMVKILGDNADMVVHLSLAVGALVGPLVAMKAAAMLGIPSITGMAASFGSLFSQLRGGGFQSLGDTRAGLQLLGEAGGITYKSLGMLGSTVAVAAVFMAAWNVGKMIGDWTGWTNAIERWAGAAGRAAGQAQTNLAVQDSLDRATKNAGRTITSYTEAININRAAADIWMAQSDKSIAAQRRRIDGELLLGKITLESANAQRQALDAEQKAADIATKRIGLNDVLKNQAKSIRDEIAATGISTGELTRLIATNEQGFDAWAKKVQLSDTTIKFLKDSVKDHAKAVKDSEEALKKHNTEQEKAIALQEKADAELAKFGIITRQQMNRELAELETRVMSAAAAGVPMKAIVQAMGAEFTELAAKAQLSGVNIDIVTASLDRFASAANLVVIPTRSFAGYMATMPAVLNDNAAAIQTVRQEAIAAATAQEKVNEAFHAFGQKTPQELRQVAEEARNSYAALVATGMATKEQLKAAYQQMIDAQRAATHQLPSMWEKDVLPRVKSVVTTIQEAVTGSFAQMLLGAKSFKNGWIDIWNSLKAGVLNILNSILAAFINNFLKGMLGAMSGQQGAFGQAFSGMFSGGAGGMGGGGGGGGGIMSQVLGGGYGGGGMNIVGGAANQTLLGGGDVGPALAGSGGGGSMMGITAGNLARFGGGGAMALMGGIETVKAWKAKNKTAGTLGGMKTGAGIGMMVGGPYGMVIGAGIGALVGFAGALGGPSKEEKARRGETGDMQAVLAQTISAQGKLEAGNEQWKTDVIAVREAYLATGRTAEEAEQAVKGMWNDRDAAAHEQALKDITIALEGQAAAAEKTKAATAASEAEATAAAEEQAARMTVFQEKIKALDDEWQGLSDQVATEAPEKDQGVVEKRARKRMADIEAEKKSLAAAGEASQAAFDAAAGKIKEDLAGVATAAADQAKIVIDENATAAEGTEAAFGKSTDEIIRLFRKMGPEAAEQRAAILAKLGDIRFVIHGDYDIPPPPPGAGGGGEPPVPGAASGIFASGKRGVATWFGEAGEPEVGGPQSFFKRIFESLGIGSGAAAAAGGMTLVLQFNVQGSLDQVVVERDVVPVLQDFVTTNRRGFRTNMRAALGIG